MKIKKLLTGMLAVLMLGSVSAPAYAYEDIPEGPLMPVYEEYTEPTLPPEAMERIYAKLFPEDEEDIPALAGEGMDSAVADKYLKKIYVNNYSSLSSAQQAELEAKARSVASMITSKYADDLSRILALNDYLCTNCHYEVTADGSSNYSKYTAYHALVEGEAVCEGYAQAFWLVTYYMDIESKIVSSSAINHAWNLVKLNGMWYHVDVTWNDPVPDSPGRSGHNNFLLSDSGIYGSGSSGHKSNDWKLKYESSQSSAIGYATDTSYDNFFWKDITSPITIINGSFYGCNKSAKTICKYDAAGASEVLADLSNSRWVIPGTNSWIVGAFCGTGAYGGRLYYNTPDSIISCAPDGSDSQVVYTVSAEEKSGNYSIYNINITDNVLTYYLSYGIYTDKVSFAPYVLKSFVLGPSEPVPSGQDDVKVNDFVDRLYIKFFGREPSAEEKQNHLTILKTMTAADDVRNFIYSPEFTNRNVTNEEFVNIMYNVFFDRNSGTEGTGWVNALNNGCSKDRIFYGFISASEFSARCSEAGIKVGSVTLSQNRDKNPETTAFVMQLYRNALNTPAPDEAGLNAWTGLIVNRTNTPAEVARGFIFSPQFTSMYSTNEAFVSQLYLALFGRQASAGEVNSWVSAMNQGSTRENVFNGFIGSVECDSYFSTFGI